MKRSDAESLGKPLLTAKLEVERKNSSFTSETVEIYVKVFKL